MKLQNGLLLLNKVYIWYLNFYCYFSVTNSAPEKVLHNTIELDNSQSGIFHNFSLSFAYISLRILRAKDLHCLYLESNLIWFFFFKKKKRNETTFSND